MTDTILIIEDDTDINNMLRTLLSGSGYNVLSAYSGTEGLLVHGGGVSLILLDIMLPGMDGRELIGKLKEKKNVPVIVTSAICDVTEKVNMFALGADDYVTKPFDNDELLARIAARLRTVHPTGDGRDVLIYRDMEMDVSGHTVSCAGIPLELSAHEFALLRLLMENPGRTCTKSVIFDRVWDDENSADDNTLNVHISKLRKKIKEIQPDADYIETVWGIGYRMRK